MIDYLEMAKRFLWHFVELAFLLVIAIMLVYLILGENSGVFVTSVANNVMKFANGVPTPSLVGIALILALVYLIMQRMKSTEEPADKAESARRK
jgi:hypothetical protein